MYNSVLYNVSMELSNHHLNIPIRFRIFITLQRNLILISSHSPFSSEPSHPAPSHPNLFSVSMDFPVLDISYKWNHTICGICDWPLLLSIMFSWFADAIVC